jgi:hypothetical protein
MGKFQGKEQCWERMCCGQEQALKCPAYPDYGRLCWPVAGTKCPRGARGIHARQIKDCERCEFFNAVVFDGLIDS